jgi:predicted deacylase
MQTPAFQLSATPFANDYQHCRNSFLACLGALEHLCPVQHRVWELDPFSASNHDASSPARQLACDAVYLGRPEAANVLVLISATHGVEGYCGSAIQCHFMSELAAARCSLPDNLAVVLIHALNPWGMHWARRCDHEGIDLNRNFIDFEQARPKEEEYARVLTCLEQTNDELRQQSMDQLHAEWGTVKFDRLCSGGQYECAWAPFYGGERPAFSRQVIEQIVQEWQLSTRELVVLDLHTGLGPWAYGELISDHPQGSTANDFARRLFGPAVAVTAEGGSFSVPKRGLMDYYWHQWMAERGCFLTLEFGSYDTRALLETVLADHRYWRDRSCDDTPIADYREHRKAMIQHFCPADSLWQQAALFKAWQVIHRVIGAYA